MKTSRRVALLGLSLLVVLIAGCQRDNHPRLPKVNKGNPGPGLSAFAIFTGGGSADGLAAQSGGDGGAISMTVPSGRLMLSDGRSVPNPTTNFLTSAVMDDGEVTFADLVTLQAPGIVAGVATFTLTGQGFWLFGGILLDLSDAPFTGFTPATDVASIVITSDEPIRIDGSIVTTRTGNDAVDLALSTSHADGVVVRNLTDARGRDGFDGGDISFDASAGALLALGTIWTHGGDATSVLTVGLGGDVSLNAGLGDLLLRNGSLGTYGGTGEQDGGDAGDVSIDFANGGNASFAWSIGALGGLARDGDGGFGGDVTIDAGADTSWFVRIDTRGGDADTGIAGDGGAIMLGGYSHSGTVETDASGGNTSTGDGGNGGDTFLSGAQITSLLLDGRSSGGRGDTGGDGGNAGLDASGLVDGSWVIIHTRGGNGISAAGTGGQAVILASVNVVTVRDTTLYGDVNGGSASTGTGGDSGDVLVIENGAPVTNIQNTSISGTANGGNGQTGGAGGDLAAVSSLGLVQVSISGSANGGISSAGVGGDAGDFVAISDSGSVDAWFQGTAIGGSGVGGDGGAGGDILIVSSNIGSAGGSALGAGSFDGSGGASDMTGGVGGTAFLDAGDTGNCTLDQMLITLRGGTGDVAGGDGGQLDASVVGTLNIDGSTVDLSGGASATGAGGAGGSFELFTDNGSVLVLGTLRANGGSGVTSGGNGGTLDVITDADSTGDAGDLLVDGTISLNGGSASAGTGGLGGDMEVFASSALGTSGSVVIHGSINARGGSGTGGGDGGLVYLTTDVASMAVTGVINVNGSSTDGDGGNIVLGDDIDGNPGLLTIGATAQLRANGSAIGVAGFIDLNPAGVGPNNPNLVESISAIVQTNDGDGTDQSATNVTRD